MRAFETTAPRDPDVAWASGGSVEVMVCGLSKALVGEAGAEGRPGGRGGGDDGEGRGRRCGSGWWVVLLLWLTERRLQVFVRVSRWWVKRERLSSAHDASPPRLGGPG